MEDNNTSVYTSRGVENRNLESIISFDDKI